MPAPCLSEVILGLKTVCDLAERRVGIRSDLQAEVVEGEIGEHIQARECKVSGARIRVIAPEGYAQLILHGGGEIVEFRYRAGIGDCRRGLEEHGQRSLEIDAGGIGVDVAAANLILIADIPVDGDYGIVSIVV